MNESWEPAPNDLAGLQVASGTFIEEVGRGSTSVVYRGLLIDGSEVAYKLHSTEIMEGRILNEIRELLQAKVGSHATTLFP